MLDNFKIQELARKANLHHLNTESCRKFAELVIAENKRKGLENHPNKMTGRDLSDYKKGTRVKILYGNPKGSSGTIVDDRWMWNYDKDSDYWTFCVRMDDTGCEYKFNVCLLEIIKEETAMNNMTLRDQFAAAALSGCYGALMAKLVDDGATVEQASTVVALESYSMADAMLKVRSDLEEQC